MKFYHITRNNDKVKDSILKNGIRANKEVDIFVFENKSFCHPITKAIINVADSIAQNQIFLSEYVMFEIDMEGIIGEILPDKVAEWATQTQ